MGYIVIIFCLIIFIRVFTYNRSGSKHNHLMSLAAIALMVMCGGTIIYILSGRIVVDVKYWPLVGLLGFYTWSIVARKGNVAMLFVKHENKKELTK